jgi:UDP-N-acetylmuramyl tripeptide synthase
MTVSQLAGKGSGTSIGGVVSELYVPGIVSYFQDKYTKIIFISGTNGKTTTRSLINHFLEHEGKKVCSNRGGANIFRGIVSSLMADVTIGGSVRSEYLVLEVEEATLPKLTPYLQPDILVLTNIFRDQLDAYGEIDKTLQFFTDTITATSPVVIANKDDHKLINAISPVTDILYGYTVDSSETIRFEPSSTPDHINYQDYVTVSNNTNTDISITVSKDTDKQYTGYTQLPGTYNLYNIAAAIATAAQLLDTYDYISSLKSYSPAFGRGESIIYKDKNIHLFLVKNPAGYDSVLEHVKRTFAPEDTHILFALNDNIADGKDVSWIWDVDFESFFDTYSPSQIHTLGTRSFDMLLRVQYAQAEVTIEDGGYSVEEMIATTSNSSSNKNILILATYTALLSIRKDLSHFIDSYSSHINTSGD